MNTYCFVQAARTDTITMLYSLSDLIFVNTYYSIVTQAAGTDTTNHHHALPLVRPHLHDDDGNDIVHMTSVFNHCSIMMQIAGTDAITTCTISLWDISAWIGLPTALSRHKLSAQTPSTITTLYHLSVVIYKNTRHFVLTQISYTLLLHSMPLIRHHLHEYLFLHQVTAGTDTINHYHTIPLVRCHLHGHLLFHPDTSSGTDSFITACPLSHVICYDWLVITAHICVHFSFYGQKACICAWTGMGVLLRVCIFVSIAYWVLVCLMQFKPWWETTEPFKADISDTRLLPFVLSILSIGLLDAVQTLMGDHWTFQGRYLWRQAFAVCSSACLCLVGSYKLAKITVLWHVSDQMVWLWKAGVPQMK